LCFFSTRERGDNCKGRWVAVVVRGFQCVKCGSISSACWGRFFSSLTNEGCPVFLPSVAFPFILARLSPLVELAAWTWTAALTSVIAWVCRSCRLSCFSSSSWQLDRFVVNGYICRGLLPWRNCAGQLGFFF